ncbi:hypothetical protein FYK55_27255 [Roseiconus nitratireducens]|uniref:Uncharacterized protein n=1 Tax=Roseiconus nitratireducens TaxID=2605748 RepID=A0A5M6CTE5_9BACT|nr:hypothetical protein [Roseiconus nitratireducens]KAA5538588.1 hypothetical protein FYK55_27255 [Roseiconus nitratireducens]
MAKKRRQQNLDEKLRDSKTAIELLDILIEETMGGIEYCQSQLKKRDAASKAVQSTFEEILQRHESELRTLQRRRRRLQEIQENKKIPAKLKKQISALERDIILLGRSSWSGGSSTIRNRKRDLADLLEQVEICLNPPKRLKTVNDKFKVGESYSRQSVTRSYDSLIWQVLRAHFEFPSTTRSGSSKVVIAAALPAKEEYAAVKEMHFTKTLETLVNDAYEIVAELAEEMEEAFENTPESLQDSDIGQAREEAASQLESISADAPEVPDSLQEYKVIHFPSKSGKSRADRAGVAAGILRAAIGAVRQHLDPPPKLPRSERKSIDEFLVQLERDIDEIESVEFPGMYG